MSEARKASERHPSTNIPQETVEEISYRVYLQRLEPPLTPEQSRAKTILDDRDKVVASDKLRRERSVIYEPMTRAYLRALVDLGLVTP